MMQRKSVKTKMLEIIEDYLPKLRIYVQKRIYGLWFFLSGFRVLLFQSGFTGSSTPQEPPQFVIRFQIKFKHKTVVIVRFICISACTPCLVKKCSLYIMNSRSGTLQCLRIFWVFHLYLYCSLVSIIYSNVEEEVFFLRHPFRIILLNPLYIYFVNIVSSCRSWP